MCRPEFSKDQQTKAGVAAATAESIAATTLAKDDEWMAKFDYDRFTEEIRALGKKLESEQGDADVAHLNKMIMWSNCCAAVGLLTMGFGVNPISIIGLSLYTFSRWTMIAHHTCHGGYEKCHPNKARWSRFKFALGTLWRRFNDWFDWMMPEAWNVEHNNRHHYNLSEIHDPDLVERNLDFLRNMDAPVALKYIIVGFMIMIWKWSYYAPNTYKELKLAQMRREGKKLPSNVNPADPVTVTICVLGGNYFYSLTELIMVVLGPYLVLHFFVTPLPYLYLGQYLSGYTGSAMYWSAVKNLFLAELLTNVHGFAAIVTNHAGDDMYRFRHGCRPFSGSFYLRQVLASVDFATGTDLIDFMHGWLNYQIEHHLWPNLSMLSYQKSAPQVKEICQRYGVPYVQESVFIRVKKTVDIMVGNTSMKWFPESYENMYLEKDALLEAAALRKDQ
jgi:fatty acid desaturase